MNILKKIGGCILAISLAIFIGIILLAIEVVSLAVFSSVVIFFAIVVAVLLFVFIPILIIAALADDSEE